MQRRTQAREWEQRRGVGAGLGTKGRGAGRGLFRARPHGGSRAPRFLSDSAHLGEPLQRRVKVALGPLHSAGVGRAGDWLPNHKGRCVRRPGAVLTGPWVRGRARAKSPGSAPPGLQSPAAPRGSPSASAEPRDAQVSAAKAGPVQPAFALAGARRDLARAAATGGGGVRSPVARLGRMNPRTPPVYSRRRPFSPQRYRPNPSTAVAQTRAHLQHSRTQQMQIRIHQILHAI